MDGADLMFCVSLLQICDEYKLNAASRLVLILGTVSRPVPDDPTALGGS